MKLDELRSAQAKERRKDSLQHLRDSFYDDVAAYVADLRAARDRRAEQVDKPFSDDDVRRMSDEVETAEEVAEALYERRVGKVVKLASFAAADMPVDEDGMTTEERRLFDDLVDRITDNKSRVLDVLSGEASPASADATETGDDVSPDDALGEAGAAEAIGAPSSTEETSAADPAPPAPDPEPPAETPTEAPARDGGGSSGSADAGGSGDALAGAMGGSDEEVADALDATTDGGSRSAGDPTGGNDATGPDSPTEVPPEPAPPGAPGTDADGGTEKTVDDGEAGDISDPDTADPNATDRVTVRITRDVGAIFGVDEREYDLAREDVVTLPAENADPLVQRDAAERFD